MSEASQVWAVFADARAALAIGQRWPDAEVFSSEPIESPHGNHAAVRTRVGLAAVVGGVLGGLMGSGLASVTSIWMGLQVGGLPRLAAPAIGIVTFAIAALGAISGVLIVLLVRGRILRLKLEVPEFARHRVADGAVAVMLRVRAEERAQMARELAAAGAEVQVETDS